MHTFTVPASLTSSLGSKIGNYSLVHTNKLQHATARARKRKSRVCSYSSNAAPLDELREWIASQGGYVHPVLQLVDIAPSSHCRGVIATQAITIADLERGPVISIPQDLQFCSTWTIKLIQQLASEAAAATAVEQLTDSQLIAAALAHEINQAESSWWRPYLQTLPQQPPNPWLLTDQQQVHACIQPYACSRGAGAVAGWAEATASYRQDMLAEADQVIGLLGPVLGVSQDQVLIALGHVLSRSLSRGSSSGLVPFIDLINHGAEARAPMLQLDDNDKLMITVLPIQNGEAVSMQAGEELLISYQGGYTPLEAFLKFGFVADEWWLQ